MTRKHSHPCAIAEALNILGDRWSLLLIREAFYGATRFGEFLKNTGISRNLLTERLAQLVESGILETAPLSDRGTTHDYHLTEKGRALDGVMLALTDWGNRYIYGEGKEPVRLIDAQSGKPVIGIRPILEDGQTVEPEALALELGPGGDGRTRQRLATARLHLFSSEH